MSQLEGGCLCGAVRYRSTAEPVMTLLCQCKQCQRQSGSSFSVNVGFAKGTLEHSGDEPGVYQHKGGSGQNVHRHFCRKCGSPVMTELDVTPELDWLKAGTLDNTAWLQPQVSIWGAEGQPWFALPASVQAFAQNPPTSTDSP
jgi:hypothetical protein